MLNPIKVIVPDKGGTNAERGRHTGATPSPPASAAGADDRTGAGVMLTQGADVLEDEALPLAGC